jgi:hypothetical protein
MKPLAIGFAAVCITAGCGGSTHASAPVSSAKSVTTVVATPTTTAPPDHGQIYLRLAAPANAAVDMFDRGLRALSPNMDLPASLLLPYAAAVNTFDEKILRVKWPPNTEADIKTLVQDDSVLVADLSAANNQTALSAGSFENQLNSDEAKDGSEAQIVRADLDLPPPPP